MSWLESADCLSLQSDLRIAPLNHYLLFKYFNTKLPQIRSTVTVRYVAQTAAQAPVVSDKSLFLSAKATLGRLGGRSARIR